MPSSKLPSSVINAGRSLTPRTSEQLEATYHRSVQSAQNYTHVPLKGLDEAYRRTSSSSGNMNTPGDGGTIVRDGGAVTILAPDLEHGSNFWPDPQLASLRLLPERTRAPAAGWATGFGGDIGIWHESDTNISGSFSAEVTRSIPIGPALMDVLPVDIRADLGGPSDDQPLITRISPESLATINPTSAGDALSRRTIQCGGDDFFQSSGSTIIRRRFDLLEVTWEDDSRPPETFIIDSILTDTTVSVLRLNGATPDLGATSTSVRIRILQPILGAGGNLDTWLPNFRRFFYVVPPARTSDGDVDLVTGPAFFGASESNPSHVLTWGHTTGHAEEFAHRGSLSSNGDIHTFGRCTVAKFRLAPAEWTVGTSSDTVELSMANHSHDIIIESTLDGPYAIPVTLIDHDPARGDILSITVVMKTGVGSNGAVSIDWPTDFIFSGSDGVIPTFAESDIVIKYEFLYHSSGDLTGWLATRTDYSECISCRG